MYATVHKHTHTHTHTHTDIKTDRQTDRSIDLDVVVRGPRRRDPRMYAHGEERER